MAKGLTKRQEMILQYVLDYVQREGYPPSIREIGANFKIGSLRGVTVQMVNRIEGAFLLRIKGDSMSGEGIMPRDLVMVKPQRTANHGDLVAVLLGEEATVKRINYAKDGVKLMPSNPNYSPIPVEQDDAQIIGKIVGLLRDYEGMAF